MSSSIEEIKSNIEKSKLEYSKPFAREAELAQKLERQAELEAELLLAEKGSEEKEAISEKDMTYLLSVAKTVYQTVPGLSVEQGCEEFLESIKESARQTGYEKMLGILKDAQNGNSQSLDLALDLEI